MEQDKQSTRDLDSDQSSYSNKPYLDTVGSDILLELHFRAPTQGQLLKRLSIFQY